MTVLIKSSRTEAAQDVAKDRRQRATEHNYSSAMVDAEELIRALEILGVIKFSDESRPINLNDRQS